MPISVARSRVFSTRARVLGGPAAHWGHRAAFNYDLRVHLPKVTQPILLINPNDDLRVQSRRGLALMRNGRLHDIPQHAHGFMELMTEEFAAVLRRFLDEDSPTSDHSP